MDFYLTLWAVGWVLWLAFSTIRVARMVNEGDLRKDNAPFMVVLFGMVLGALWPLFSIYSVITIIFSLAEKGIGYILKKMYK